MVLHIFFHSKEADCWLKTRFINREGIDFSDVESMQAVQVFPSLFTKLQKTIFPKSETLMSSLKEWELAENLQGVLEYQTRCFSLHISSFIGFPIGASRVM